MIMTILIFLSSLIFILSTDPSVRYFILLLFLYFISFFLYFFICFIIYFNRYQPSDCSDPVCDNTDLCPGRVVCEPIPPASLFYIDATCVVVFTIDYVTRLCIVPWMPSRF